MGDFAEHLPDDHPQRDLYHESLQRLVELIERTPYLDWLLLTKRPQNIESIGLPNLRNIWLGTTVESTKETWRIDSLLGVSGQFVRFISAEPLLEQLDLRPWLPRLDWVIAGGESGRGARPMHPDWPRFLRDQCLVANVPFFFKQWGAWAPGDQFSAKSMKRLVDVRYVLPFDAPPEVLEAVKPVEMVRLGSKHTGAMLDGKTHLSCPRQMRLVG